MKDFDPACLFLLDMGYLNLFEPASASGSCWHFRCKGCREVIPGSHRAAHHKRHKANRERTIARTREKSLKKARAAQRRVRT